MTTHSDHAGLIYPDLAKGVVPDRPNQLWVAVVAFLAIERASYIVGSTVRVNGGLIANI